MDKIIKVFFAFLLLFGLLIALLYLSETPENATGITDATFNTLQRSGQTVAVTNSSKWLAFLFGVGIISIFGFFIFIGARKKNPILRKQINKILWLGLFFYLLVYYFMVSAWWEYTETNSMDYFLGLPKPTAWMFFGLMTIPFFLSFFYITRFKEWIYTPEDEARFKAIVANRRNRNCLLYTSPSPRDRTRSRMPSSA